MTKLREKLQISHSDVIRVQRYLYKCITLFVRGRCCTTMARNVSRFLGEVNSRPQFSFHFLNLKTSPLEFISRKIAIISKN